MDRLFQFDETLRSASIPIDGVSGRPPRLRIDFRPEATPAQRAQAQQIAEQFDWRERQPKAMGMLIGELEALPPAQLQQLLLASLAALLQEQPDFARRLGIPLDGDEPT